MKRYHFTGAGNNFVVLDGRGADVSAFRETGRIVELCRQYGTDGLMILDTDPEVDFSMDFFNPDGSGGMMCGNGGRCIVAFADWLGIKPAGGDEYLFRAPDGLHRAVILERPKGNGGGASCAAPKWTVRLKMIDVEGVEPMMGGWFLNTGTRHFVRFVEGVNQVDIDKEGPRLRWEAAFAPEGTNANFVEVASDGLHVRTFEKGVEGETLACGTGITASAIAAYAAGVPGCAGTGGELGTGGSAGAPGSAGADQTFYRQHYRLQCRRGDWLQVEFIPAGPESFTEVWLTGPAEML